MIPQAFSIGLLPSGVRSRGPGLAVAFEAPLLDLRGMLLGEGQWANILAEAGDGEKLDCPAWIPAAFLEAGDAVSSRSALAVDLPSDARWVARKAANVAALSCLVFDFDGGDSLSAIRAFSRLFCSWGYTSWSHTPAHPKARVVFPFVAPVPASMWPSVWGAAARWAAHYGLAADPATKDPGRCYFLAAAPLGGWFDRETWEELSVDADGLPRLLSADWLERHYPAPPPAPAPRRVGVANPFQDLTGAKDRLRRAYLSKIVDAMAAEASGGRNLALFRRACAMGRRLEADRAQDEMTYWRSELLAAAMASGLSEREASTALDRGLAEGAKG